MKLVLTGRDPRPLLCDFLLSGGSSAGAVVVSLVFALTPAAGAEENESAPVTFHRDVAPIIYENCTTCHRPGENAPFSLRNFKEVRKRARLIRRVTQSGYMPPWHPAPGWGDFQDSRGLTETQIETLARWVEAGTPEGDPQAAPPVPEFPQGWQLGEPDLVVSMSEAYEVPADGPDIYRNFVIPLDLKEDRWVTAVEIRPSARTVVHHCLYFLDNTGKARERDARDETPGFRGMGFRRSGSLGGWAVGGTPRHLPLDLAYPLPRGSDLILSMHFHPSGKAEKEKTTLGLYFADEPPERTLAGFQVPPLYGRFEDIDIPAGEEDYVVRGTFEVPCDIDLVTANGHAHYICRSMQAVATLPDGEKIKLFRIGDWDFNWQGNYNYTRPVRLPRGTIIEAEIHYDNSTNNPHNPFQPPQRIRWGLQSTDEMGSLIFGCVPVDEADLGELKWAIRRHLATRGRSIHPDAEGGRYLNFINRVARLDANRNGKIEREEVPSPFTSLFDSLDTDGDGVVGDEAFMSNL